MNYSRHKIWDDFSFSLMLKFIPEEVPSKRFFSQASGYTAWNQLNKDYQVKEEGAKVIHH